MTRRTDPPTRFCGSTFLASLQFNKNCAPIKHKELATIHTNVFLCFTNFILSSNTIFIQNKSDETKISSSLTTRFYANFAICPRSINLNKCNDGLSHPGSFFYFLLQKMHLFKIQLGDISKISCDPLCTTVRNAYISPVWPLNWHQEK